ncbi:MAG TPA: Yip1 family protein [bacterium]|nr:Yip1 family protein [bacterium]HPN44554.1 Yip1 family protein [bacterium]
MNERIEPSPWSTIWLRPKETIRRIVDTNPRYQVIFLAILGGIGQTLANARGMGDMFSFGALIFLCLLAGPMGGLLSLYISGFVMHWTSARLGGTATREQVRAVIAWSWAPIVYTLPLWGVKYILFREELFTTGKTFIESQPALSFLFELFTAVDFVITIWYLMILFIGLAEVNRISVGRGIAAAVLAFVLVGIPALLLVYFLAPQGMLGQ